MPRIRSLALLIAIVAPVAIGCGGGDGGGGIEGLLGNGDGDGDVTFPPLPAPLLEVVCWRGNATVGDEVSGSVVASDCDAVDFDPNGVGYFEVWRVRVASAKTVTFDAESQFDNWLTLLRLVSYDEDTGEVAVQFLEENDDRSDNNLNALITYPLQPDADYFISVSGFDYDETGPYTLLIQ